MEFEALFTNKLKSETSSLRFLRSGGFTVLREYKKSLSGSTWSIFEDLRSLKSPGVSKLPHLFKHLWPYIPSMDWIKGKFTGKPHI